MGSCSSSQRLFYFSPWRSSFGGGFFRQTLPSPSRFRRTGQARPAPRAHWHDRRALVFGDG
jgi:hypothetical protein